jgi:nitrite reductase/ring-hydroxylating ferredoxin subunit
MGAERHALCALGDIADGGARGFTIGEGPARREILICRRGAAVFAYVNSCPHTGSPLDWQPDQFLSLDRRHLQCATHGALFRFEDGLCLAGPCLGRHLTPVPIERRGTNLYLAEA